MKKKILAIVLSAILIALICMPINVSASGFSTLIVPNGTAQISNNQFSNCSGFKSVTVIPDSVSSIGLGAFANCEDLRYLIIPRTVTYIGEGAFSSCSNLTLIVEENSAAHMHAICYGIPFRFTIYPDVFGDAWYYNAVVYTTKNGYFSGYSNGAFGPADSISRNDFIVVLARIDGVDLNRYSGSTEFDDVDPDGYYAKAIEWASSNGIINGYSHNGNFGVGDCLTREQLVTIIFRYIRDFKGKDTTTNGFLARAYNDFPIVSGFSQDAVIWAIDKGVIRGMNGQNIIAPTENTSRAQVAQILLNINNNNIFNG